MINCIARIQNTNALPCMEAGASAYPQIPSFIPNPGTGIHLYPAEQRSQPSQSAIPRSARAGVISSSRKVFYMYKQEPKKNFLQKNDDIHHAPPGPASWRHVLYTSTPECHYKTPAGIQYGELAEFPMSLRQRKPARSLPGTEVGGREPGRRRRISRGGGRTLDRPVLPVCNVSGCTLHTADIT